MDALVLWRDAALRGKLARSPSRSPSPGWGGSRTPLKNIDEEGPYASDEDRRRPKERTSSDMSGSTVAEKTPPPSSSSWVRWWSRSRNAEPAQRPNLKSMNTAPTTMVRRSPLLCTLVLIFVHSKGATRPRCSLCRRPHGQCLLRRTSSRVAQPSRKPLVHPRLTPLPRIASPSGTRRRCG